mgnify:CR=1 FL=1
MAAAGSQGSEPEQADGLDGEGLTLAEAIGEGTEFAKAALGTDGEGPAEAVKDLLSPQSLFVVDVVVVVVIITTIIIISVIIIIVIILIIIIIVVVAIISLIIVHAVWRLSLIHI